MAPKFSKKNKAGSSTADSCPCEKIQENLKGAKNKLKGTLDKLDNFKKSAAKKLAKKVATLPLKAVPFLGWAMAAYDVYDMVTTGIGISEIVEQFNKEADIVNKLHKQLEGCLGKKSQVDGKTGQKLKQLSKKNQKEFDDMYKKAPDTKKEIDNISDNIARDVDAKVAKAPIKSKDRAIEKIVNDYDGNPTKIKDLSRNTIITSEKNVDSVIGKLKEKGANIKIIDSKSDPLGYSGVNSTIKTNTGLTGEIQVNTPAMIYGKESEEMGRKLLGNDTYDSIAKKAGIPGGEGHKLYEDWRVLSDDSPIRATLEKKSKDYYNTIRRSINGN